MILRVTKVTNPRRTTLKGRASLAYDFARDRAGHARNMEENALKKTAGTILFDDADRQVARVEIHLFAVGARLAFVNTRENEHIVNFDFKKFDVGMHQEIRPD